MSVYLNPSSKKASKPCALHMARQAATASVYLDSPITMATFLSALVLTSPSNLLWHSELLFPHLCPASHLWMHLPALQLLACYVASCHFCSKPLLLAEQQEFQATFIHLRWLSSSPPRPSSSSSSSSSFQIFQGLYFCRLRDCSSIKAFFFFFLKMQIMIRKYVNEEMDINGLLNFSP